MKRSTKQYIAVALVSMIVVGGAAAAAFILTTGKIRESYEGRLQAATQALKENERTVYKATELITAGKIITTENAIQETVYSSQRQERFIDANDLGKVALVNISPGEEITKNLITEEAVSSELRETSYEEILNGFSIQPGDTVDVRIMFPNGENFIVLSKKQLIDVNQTKRLSDSLADESTDESTGGSNTLTEAVTTSHFWLNEEEIVRMSSAIVDAYLYTGAELYTTEYIEPTLQEASIVNYTPSLAVINLIKNDPNIIKTASKYLSNEVRKDLENRLANSIKSDVKETNWHIDTDAVKNANDAAKGDVADIVTDETTDEDFFYYSDEEEAVEEDLQYGE